jgi:hypothetical protein
MTISDWIVILVILAAPIIALQIQKYIEDRKEIRARKMQIFRTLMATRANRLNLNHIEALNMIDIEFFKNEKVKEKWKLLLDNFVNYPQDPNEKNYESRLSSCAERSDALFVDLLFEMAKSLDYKFDEVHLKRNIYVPKGQVDTMKGQEFIRSAFVEILSGKRSIPIKVLNVTKENTEEQMKKLKHALTKKNKI